MAVLVDCRVPTGWGSAVNTANVAPGNMVAVHITDDLGGGLWIRMAMGLS